MEPTTNLDPVVKPPLTMLIIVQNYLVKSLFQVTRDNYPHLYVFSLGDRSPPPTPRGATQSGKPHNVNGIIQKIIFL